METQKWTMAQIDERRRWANDLHFARTDPERSPEERARLSIFYSIQSSEVGDMLYAYHRGTEVTLDSVLFALRAHPYHSIP